jgi:hypothetical protein
VVSTNDGLPGLSPSITNTATGAMPDVSTIA